MSNSPALPMLQPVGLFGFLVTNRGRVRNLLQRQLVPHFQKFII